jgi:branched-chain amino acid transport system permease protein
MHNPSGVFNETYEQDLAIFRTRWQWFLLAGGLALAFAAPTFLNSYMVGVLILILTTVIVIHGLNILTGYCGQISLAQAAFAAAGAYTSVLLCQYVPRMPWFPQGATDVFVFWFTVPLGGLVAGLVGIFFGVPALRLKGFYLVMATLAAHFIILHIITHAIGTQARTLPAPHIGDMVLNDPGRYYYVVLVATIVVTYLVKNLVRTRFGRAWIAIRDNDLAAEVMGISLFRYKLSAFFLGCFLAGIGGALWAHYTRSITPEYYNLIYGLWYLGYLIVGGMGSVVGPFFGAGFLIILTEALAFVLSALGGTFFGIETYLSAARDVLFGLVVVAFMVLEPRGIAHRWNIFKAYYRLFPYAH